MARHLIDTDVDSLIKIFPIHAELGAKITRLAYELLKRYAKSDGLRTFDALIAATAIEESLTLVSKNRKHFQMISELRLEVPSYGRIPAPCQPGEIE